MTHLGTARQRRTEVKNAIDVPRKKEREVIWQRIESSKKDHINVANEEESVEFGEELDYLLEVVEKEIDNYHYYTSLKQDPKRSTTQAGRGPAMD